MATQHGVEGKKAVALSLLMLFLLAGADELPFMENAEDVIDGIAQHVLGLDFRLKTKRHEFFEDLVGKDAARFLNRGITGIPGVPLDISGRMGMGNPIPGTAMFRRDETSNDRSWGEIAGPIADLVQRGGQALGQAARGDVLKAAETLSPVAVRNVTKAVDMAEKGYYTDTKGKKVIDTDAGDVLSKLIGFQPSSVAQDQARNLEATRIKNLNRAVESEIADMWATGRATNDPKKIEEARKKLREWNEKNPQSPIRINQGQLVRRVREMKKTKAQRIADSSPKEIRASVRRTLTEENSQ